MVWKRCGAMSPGRRSLPSQTPKRKDSKKYPNNSAQLVFLIIVACWKRSNHRSLRYLHVGRTSTGIWLLQPRRIAPPHLLAQVWNQLKTDQMDAAQLRQLRANSPLGRILATGLSNARHGRDVMKESIEETASHVVHELERKRGKIGCCCFVDSQRPTRYQRAAVPFQIGRLCNDTYVELIVCYYYSVCCSGDSSSISSENTRCLSK